MCVYFVSKEFFCRFESRFPFLFCLIKLVTAVSLHDFQEKLLSFARVKGGGIRIGGGSWTGGREGGILGKNV